MTALKTGSEINPAIFSEQAQAEIERLLTLVDRYEQILNSASEGIINVSQNGTVFSANQELYKIINVPVGTITGKTVFQLIKQLAQPKQVKALSKLVKEALSGRPPISFELEYQNRILEISARIEPKFNGVTGILRDITQRKQHELELQQTETLYRSLFENAPILYITTTRIEDQPIISDCNDSFISRLGYSREQVIGQSIHNFYTAESINKLYAGYGYQRALSGEFDLEERSFITINGTIIHSLIRSVPFYGEDGVATGTLTLFLDITERKETEQELEQASKLKSILFKIVQAGEIFSDFKSFFKVVRDEVIRIFETANFYITLYDREKNLLSFPVWTDEKDQQPDATPPGEGIIAYLIKTGQSQLLTKQKLKLLTSKGEVKIIGSAPASWLGVPLKIENEIIGVMAIYHYDSQSIITDQDREILEIVASQISETIAKKQAEDALRASEERFRSLYENSTIGLYRTSPKGEILLANPTLVKMLGYDSLSELQGKNLEDDTYFYGRGRADFKRSVEQVGEIRGYESTWVQKNGLELHVRESARVIRDEKGHTVYYEGTVEDVTAGKRREHLLEALNRIALAVESTLDLDDIYNTVNIEFKKLGFQYILVQKAPDNSYLQIKYHRYSSLVVKAIERLLGFSIKDYKAPVIQSEVLREIINEKQTVLITDTKTFLAQTLTKEFSNLAGKVIKITKGYRAIGAPLIVEDEVHGILMVMSGKLEENDIPAISIFARQFASIWYKAELFNKARQELAERTRAEEALRISEEKYRTIIESTLDGIFIIQNDKIEFCNQRFANIFGYQTADDVYGRRIDGIFTAEYLKKISNLLVFYDSGVNKTDQTVCKMQTIDGDIFDTEVQSNIIIYNGLPAIQGVMRDISEKINLAEQLRQSQKIESIGHLAGGIAHDFNNMLGGIIGFSELTLKHVFEPEYVSNNLRKIIRKCDDTAQLVQQLLAFSRKQVLDIQPLNLNSTIEGSIKFLQKVIGASIDISHDLTSDISTIQGDLIALDQSITNVCINARDAMPDGGKIELQTRNVTIDNLYCRNHPEAIPGDFVRLKITDDGIGMDEETMNVIFEPFFTTKETGKGTGLGLSMVYGLVKQHNGFIVCESELGKGTSISLFFPVRIDKISEIEPAKITAISGGSETILLVEDEKDLVLILQTILEEYGYRVLKAENGVEALKIYDKNRKDIKLIISDVVMPKMGGARLYNVIHTKDPDAKFLFITGYMLDESFKLKIEVKQLDLLNKPFRKETVAKKVREILDR